LAEVLAGEPCTDEVNGFKFGSGESFDVAMTLYLRPVLL
jgi:hypothetical protein